MSEGWTERETSKLKKKEAKWNHKLIGSNIHIKVFKLLFVRGEVPAKRWKRVINFDYFRILIFIFFMAQKQRPPDFSPYQTGWAGLQPSMYLLLLSRKSGAFPETKNHRISLETMEELIRQVMQQSEERSPLPGKEVSLPLWDLNFTKKVIEFETKYGHGKQVGNGFQTNGTLLDREWAKFLEITIG